MTRRRRWSFWMPPLDHPPILWLDDRYRGWLTENGRVMFWGVLISLLSLIASGSFLIALLLGFAISVLVLSAMAGVFARPHMSIQVRRDELPGVREGDQIHYRVNVTNSGSRTVRHLLIEERGLMPEIRPVKSPAMIAELLPGESKSVILTLSCLRRGAYTLDCLQIATSLPTGFVKVGRFERQDRLIVVQPRPINLRCEKILRTAKHIEHVQHQNFVNETSTELIGLRQWQAGDQMRDVHWRATARRGHLVAKEHAPESNSAFVIFLDLEARSAKDEQRLDNIISIAIALARYAFAKRLSFSVCNTANDLTPKPNAYSQTFFEKFVRKVSSLESVRKTDFGVAERVISQQNHADLVVLLLAKVDKDRREFVNQLRSAGYRLSIRVISQDKLPEAWIRDDRVEVWV